VGLSRRQKRSPGATLREAEIYIERSPLYHVDKLKVPLSSTWPRRHRRDTTWKIQQIVDAPALAKPDLGRDEDLRGSPTWGPSGGHAFSRRVDPKTLQRVDSAEQIDSWNGRGRSSNGTCGEVETVTPAVTRTVTLSVSPHVTGEKRKVSPFAFACLRLHEHASMPLTATDSVRRRSSSPLPPRHRQECPPIRRRDTGEGRSSAVPSGWKLRDPAGPAARRHRPAAGSAAGHRGSGGSAVEIRRRRTGTRRCWHRDCWSSRASGSPGSPSTSTRRNCRRPGSRDARARSGSPSTALTRRGLQLALHLPDGHASGSPSRARPRLRHGHGRHDDDDGPSPPSSSTRVNPSAGRRVLTVTLRARHDRIRTPTAARIRCCSPSVAEDLDLACAGANTRCWSHDEGASPGRSPPSGPWSSPCWSRCRCLSVSYAARRRNVIAYRFADASVQGVRRLEARGREEDDVRRPPPGRIDGFSSFARPVDGRSRTANFRVPVPFASSRPYSLYALVDAASRQHVAAAGEEQVVLPSPRHSRTPSTRTTGARCLPRRA